MTKVHILPPEIISKIAAGEVIDRPASVIKELIENALDAKTKSIELHLKQAGKTSIHIKDAGHGIAQDDIENVFKRHATSKIESIDDLFNIHSLGFRGEALYSIAAISDIILRSKTSNQDSGWEIHLQGGKKLDLKPCNMPTGTEIEVKELFFNTPARRKFLKSNTTEMNQILNNFIPYCLFHNECSFLLKHQNKTTLDLKSIGNLAERIAETLNLETDHLLETQQDFREQNISIRMIIGDINIVRSRRDMQFVFINGRPIQNKSISFHMNNIYRLILPPNNFPFFAVYIDMPADDIDVNIHPTKREVKLKDEQTLCAMLRHMTEHTLMMKGRAKEVTRPQGHKVTGEKTISIAEKALKDTSSREENFDFSNATKSIELEDKFEPRQPTEQYSFPKDKPYSFDGENLFEKKQDNLQSKLDRSNYAGSFLNKFLFFECDKSLLVIDQHAAQERITFESLIDQMEKGKVEAQNLLSPYIVKLSPQDILVWEEAKERLEETGFSTTQFDNETIAVHSYPVLLKDPTKAVRDILSGKNVAKCDHQELARRACRASTMSGDRLNQQQAEFIKNQLTKCRDPFTCPHGRPTVVEMTESFLDRQFLRT